MLRAIKVKLYPNKTQAIYLGKLLGCYRLIYNEALGFKKESYELDKTNINLSDLSKKFHGEWLKSDEFDFLNEHNTKVLKQSIRDMLDAYKRFFKNGSGFPNFKSKHSVKQSARFPLESISIKNNYLNNRLTLNAQVKNIKFKTSDKYKIYLDKNKDGIRSATLSKSKTGVYTLSFLVDGDLLREANHPINESIGIDLGIKDFIITDKGETRPNIKSNRNNKHSLKKLHQNLSKKMKGSKNKEKARIKLAKKHEKINNIKENYLHEVSNWLIDENQIIAIENLSVKNMMKNHKLAKSIQELSLNRFKNILKYKAEWYGRTIVEVGRFYPSSKTCYECGNIYKGLTLSDRIWACPNCDAKIDRDINAAKNIKREGLRILNEENNTRPLRGFKAFGEETLVSSMN